MFQKTTNLLISLQNFFSQGFQHRDIQKLILKETPGLLEFYGSELPKNASKHKVVRFFLILKIVFKNFLAKMNGTRRIIFLISMFFFFLGIMEPNSLYLFTAFSIVTFLLAFEIAEKTKVVSELDIAQDVQKKLLPTQLPFPSDLDYAAYLEPAKLVGGDFYFVQKGVTEFPIHIGIGDVAGKGMSAALFMVQILSLFKFSYDKNDSVLTILNNMNEFTRKSSQFNMFFTCFYSILHENYEIELYRCGHLSLMHYHSQSDQIHLHQPNGIAIGIAKSSLFQKQLQHKTITLEKNDWLLWITDGVIEMMNEQHEEYGEIRLHNLLKYSRHRAPNEIIELIKKDLDAFRLNQQPMDDVTILIIKRI